MLTSLRARKKNIFGWVIITLLILGLGAFGFTDILTGGSAQSVARVGQTDVSVTEYRVAFENRVNAIQRQFGVRLDAAQAQERGVDGQVMASLLRSAALRDEARVQGISVPDEVVARQILATPGLAGTDGEFDSASYRFFLGQRGLNAERFEEIVRGEEEATLIGNIVASGATLPPVAADTLMAFLGEERAIDWVLVPADPEAVEAPEDDVLQAYMEELEDRYQTPERREITFARLDPAVLAQGLDYPDEELRADYEADLPNYQQAERRIVDRLAFPDAAAAEEALAEIEAGETTLTDIAGERGLSAGDISLGVVERSALPRSAREPVFSLEETGTVGPVDTDLGPALFAVKAIIPARESSFEDARDDVRANRAARDAADMILDESLRAEELIAGGATPEELAEETSYELGTATVAQGSDGIVPQEVVAEAFAAEPGADRDQIETSEGAYYVVHVDEIIEPSLPPLAEIRETVLADWRDEQALLAAAEAATELQGQLADGLTLATLAEREDLQLQSDEGITRDADSGFLPPETVARIFDAEPGETVVATDEAGGLLIALREVIPYDLEGEDAAALREVFLAQTAGDLQSDILGYFANAVAEERGITVNQTVQNQITQSLR
ncbi:peptidylprolyl isomerase [Roseobacter sp. HKCCA0434]|uniref:peptidylprolyl isomerase n=1 Tax=Roseobacter sp. HKCCA0434 TaxID=3079297 RepID=UPI002905CB1D|nr:peptidylprolyl isomerase [Roseobacter sp. HKCCA0434]